MVGPNRVAIVQDDAREEAVTALLEDPDAHLPEGWDTIVRDMLNNTDEDTTADILRQLVDQIVSLYLEADSFDPHEDHVETIENPNEPPHIDDEDA